MIGLSLSSSVSTICGRLMIGLSLSSSVNTICGRIMIGLSLLSSVSKHNMWSYYDWVVVVFVSKQDRYQDISGPGHLGTEHMRHIVTRYRISPFSVLDISILEISVLDISVLEISVLNNKNNLIEFKNCFYYLLHVDVVCFGTE